MYSLTGYGKMIADRIRMDAYAQALRQAIRPGAVVVDIGTGPGVMAVLACRLGAGHVYAMEPAEIIQVAREVAAENQYADKVEFLEDFSTKVSIPTRADVIVSDLGWILPLFGHHIPSIVDARHRFLAPGGALIGRMARIWAAIVEAPEEYRNIVGPWEENPLGQNLCAARRKVLNEFRKARVAPDQLLTAPQLWATLDYLTIENPDVRRALHWEAKRNGTGHGILLWFDMELADGVLLSNAPELPELIYGAAFFPWLEPVPVAEGQRLCVELEAKLFENEYHWRWTTQIEPQASPGELVARFRQSQLQGAVLSPAKLRKAASDYIPVLSEDGRIYLRALELMNGQSSLKEIAQRLATEFPSRFSRWEQGLSFAGAISRENCV